MEEDHRLGAEADGVARLRLASLHGPGDRAGDQLGGDERLWLDSEESESATALPWGAYGRRWKRRGLCRRRCRPTQF